MRRRPPILPIRTARSLVDTRDQPLRLLAVRRILRAEGLIQRRFLHVNSIQHSRGRRRHDSDERDPVPLLKSDCQKHQQHARVGGVADEAVKAISIDRLRFADGDVRAECLAQRQDRRPSNGYPGNQQRYCRNYQPMPGALRVPQHSVVDRLSCGDGKRNGHPQGYERSAVRHLAGAAPRAGSNGDKHLRCSPSVKQYLPQENDPQLASIFLIQHRLFHPGFRRGYAIAAAGVPVWRWLRGRQPLTKETGINPSPGPKSRLTRSRLPSPSTRAPPARSPAKLPAGFLPRPSRNHCSRDASPAPRFPAEGRAEWNELLWNQGFRWPALRERRRWS